jgi:hypothetical protein
MSIENEFSSAFSSAFDATSSDFPGPLDLCWPVNWDVCPGDVLSQITPDQQAVAEAMAVQTLRVLTGYRVGGCPVTVRPCSIRCRTSSWMIAPVGMANWAGAYGGWGFSPYIGPGGAWLNACGCRNDDCSCTEVHEVLLPGHVGNIVSVVIDDEILPTTSYRVDNGNRLVRTDGEDWPTCQDMNAESGPGTFFVTYLNGNPVDNVGSYIAGLVAAEYAKACLDIACALPSNVTSVTRQGISMQLDPDAFANGTGMRLVDEYVRIWNPYNVPPSGIYSPDDRRGRVTTWRA